MERSNSLIQSDLNAEERNSIKNAARFQRTLLRIKNGFLSLFRNALKLFIALLYLVGASKLWLYRGLLIERIYSGYGTILSTIYDTVFTWGIPILAILIFLFMLELFGIVIYYSNKFVNACISAGIYTKAGKPPWLLRRYKDRKDRIYTIWEIYLNGNEENDFTTRKKKLESELGVNIHGLEMKGTRTLFMFTTPENTKSHKANRSDMNF